MCIYKIVMHATFKHIYIYTMYTVIMTFLKYVNVFYTSKVHLFFILVLYCYCSCYDQSFSLLISYTVNSQGCSNVVVFTDSIV